MRDSLFLLFSDGVSVAKQSENEYPETGTILT